MTAPAPVAVRVAFNAAEVISAYGELGRKQLPLATSLAVQRTADQAVAAQQAHQERVFFLRTAQAKDFFRKAVRVTKRPTKTDPTALIEVRTRTRKRAFFRGYDQILLRHEEGGTFTSEATYRYRGSSVIRGGYAIPSRRFRSGTKGVPTELYPRNIGAQLRQTPDQQLIYSKRRRNKSRSKKRPRAFRETYFTLPGVGLARRLHTGAAGQASSARSAQSRAEVIWYFRPRITIRPRLGFAVNLRRTFDERIAENFRQSFDFAIRTAR